MNVILWKGANVSPLAANRSLQTIWRRVTREPAVKGCESHKYAKFYPGEANKKITVITSRPWRSKKFGIEHFYLMCHSLCLVNQEKFEKHDYLLNTKNKNCMASNHSMDWKWLWSYFHWKIEDDWTTYNEKAMVIKDIYNEKATVMRLLTMIRRRWWNYFQWKDNCDETTYNEKVMVVKLLTMKRRWWWNYSQWKVDGDETILTTTKLASPPPLTQFQSVRKKNRKQRPIYDIAQTICLRTFFFCLAYST